MAAITQNVQQAAFDIADEIDVVALAVGMSQSQRQEINAKLQSRLKAFAEAILDQAASGQASANG
jgi:hypothetical protein